MVRGCWWRRCRQTARPSAAACGRAGVPYYARRVPVFLAPGLLKLSVITVISPINRLARAAPPALFDPTFPHIFLTYSTTEPRERQPTPDPLVFARRCGFRATTPRHRDTPARTRVCTRLRRVATGAYTLLYPSRFPVSLPQPCVSALPSPSLSPRAL